MGIAVAVVGLLLTTACASGSDSPDAERDLRAQRESVLALAEADLPVLAELLDGTITTGSSGASTTEWAVGSPPRVTYQATARIVAPATTSEDLGRFLADLGYVPTADPTASSGATGTTVFTTLASATGVSDDGAVAITVRYVDTVAATGSDPEVPAHVQAGLRSTSPVQVPAEVYEAFSREFQEQDANPSWVP